MNLDWLNEHIPKLPNGNWLYNIVCFLLFKRKDKLTYRQFIMLSYGIKRKNLGEERAKERAINRAIEIYKWLNGKMPDMGESDDEE